MTEHKIIKFIYEYGIHYPKNITNQKTTSVLIEKNLQLKK